MKKSKPTDLFLEKRITRCDEWLGKGQISFSSKVIPVVESIVAKQWVHPTEQVLEILNKAKSVAVQNCECRSHYKRCDHPLEVCVLLNDVADKAVSKAEARYVESGEAAEILNKANQSGLVHLSLYMPDHEIYALCSCCPCCCHDLQLVKQYERKELMLKSEYVAHTDWDACIHCGDCIDRCIFDARVAMDDGDMKYNPESCVGCGLCITICPVEATSMVMREARGLEVPGTGTR